ncbi:hypothetical protein [Frondihabitans sp. Leaf304]|uniref:hypothetical protein n=1 Tax=Frondihabitans sp. Leaf304 TaxID=1736329 RepID=UPI0006F37053|nr:hypothetical protein [Frondihabitans sp. Leaf304]KQQ28848.1 hypothetical protein ASF54_09540 [Frondihabitans sp. Leaf304]
MSLRKSLTLITAVGAAALLLAGCSSSSNSSGGTTTTTSSAAAKPAETKAPAIAAFNVGGLLAGNAKPSYPVGDAGKIAVVGQATLVKDSIGAATLPIAYRNNTGKAVAHVDFTGAARAGGKLVATGQSQGSTPSVLQPGEIGFAFLYFDDASTLPDSGETYEFTATSSAADASSYNTTGLTVTEQTNNGTSIVGSATNKSGKALTGPYSVDVYCFTGTTLTDRVGGFADQDDDVAADGTVTFTVSLGDTKCSTYTFGVNGYYK